MQFDGNADLEFGGGKTQNNEGSADTHSFAFLRLLRNQTLKNSERRPDRVEFRENSFLFLFPPRKGAKSVEGNSRFPASYLSPQATKEVRN